MGTMMVEHRIWTSPHWLSVDSPTHYQLFVAMENSIMPTWQTNDKGIGHPVVATAQVAISEDSEHQTFFCFTRLCDGKCALLGSSLWSTRRSIESVFVTSVHSWVSSRSVVGCKKSVWCITYIYIYIHNLTHVQAEYSCLHFWHVLTNKNLSWSLKRATKRWIFSRVASFVIRAPWGDL